MGIRSNVGNVTTNAMQILSVGATTAGKVFRDRADTALVNWTDDEKTKYAQYQKDRKMAEMKAFYEKPELEKQKQAELEKQKQGDPKTYSKEWFENNPGKAKEVGIAEAEKRYNRAVGDGEKEKQSIDDLIKSEVKKALPEISEQSKPINETIFRNIVFNKKQEFVGPKDEVDTGNIKLDRTLREIRKAVREFDDLTKE